MTRHTKEESMSQTTNEPIKDNNKTKKPMAAMWEKRKNSIPTISIEEWTSEITSSPHFLDTAKLKTQGDYREAIESHPVQPAFGDRFTIYEMGYFITADKSETSKGAATTFTLHQVIPGGYQKQGGHKDICEFEYSEDQSFLKHIKVKKITSNPDLPDLDEWQLASKIRLLLSTPEEKSVIKKEFRFEPGKQAGQVEEVDSKGFKL